MTDDTVMKNYFESIEKETKKAYETAGLARSKGFDPEPEVNIPVARDLAARVEGLVGTLAPELIGSGLADKIRILEKQYGKNDERVALLAGRDIALGNLVKFDQKIKAMETGLRVAIAYLTLGVVTAPLEGLSEVRLKKNDNGKEYLAIYFAGPIRSAGGTASAMAVLAADFIRIHCGIGPYIPRQDELKRYATEVEDYYTRVTPKQYHPTSSEIEFIIKNVPVEINGDPTEKLEVSNFKDLERVETNRIRGGMCLVLLDGIPLKAEKMLKRIMKYPEDYGLKHWLWLKEFIVMKKKIHAATAVEEKSDVKYIPNAKYIDKVIAGRPIISFPGTKGGFRLRYGRSRTGGLASTSINPRTMELVEFLAVGTQIATEFPGKATVCTPCDTIEGPVVRLKSGDVIELRTREQVLASRPELAEILSLGDDLIPYGEFVSNGHMLLPSSYVEEWWSQEVSEALKKNKDYILEQKFHSKPYPPPSLFDAFRISRNLSVPLHPYYNFFWHDIEKDDLKRLIEWFSKGIIDTEKKTLTMDTATSEGSEKRTLEILCIPHAVRSGKIILEEKSYAAYLCLGSPEKSNKDTLLKKIDESSNVMESLKKLSGITIREKGIVRIGTRMGRPEKSEKRLLKGKPQILFPCGDSGGRMRNLMESYKVGTYEAQVSIYKCKSCGSESGNSYCHNCGGKTEKLRACKICNRVVDTSQHCGAPTAGYRRIKLDLKDMLDKAKNNIGIKEYPQLFKGVRGVFGASKNIEPLEKGLLRSKYDLYVNKDGTTRCDATDVSLTHFKPREIGVSVDKLKSLGYTTDTYGNELKTDEQILALFPQDIIISDNKEFSSADYLISICKFTDELLSKFYKVKPYYGVRTKEDLVGQLVIGLAPHTSAGIIGRIIGYTQARVCFAHPFWHAGKRRNCFHGDEKILVHDGNDFKLMTMRDLVESNISTATEKDDFGTEYIKTAGLKTFAFNKDTKKFELADITHVSRHIAPEKLIYIRTKSGRKLIVTEDHPLPDRHGKKVCAKDATEVLIPCRLENPQAEKLMKKWLEKKGAMKTNIHGDAFIDKIIKKKIIPNSEKYVYNLTVDAHHNLICSGIVAGNCDGDEDSVMLLMDALLNFSRQFMPDTRGGRTMDAPLVLTTCLDPEEVDDESWNVDVDDTYPLGFYQATQDYPNLWDLKIKPRVISELIGKNEVFHIQFTHDTYDISEGPKRSKYTMLDSMTDKLYSQLELEKKLRAVNASKVAEAVLSKHFLRDIKGNLRKFSKQGFRCGACNEKFRRVPLIGKCTRCGGKILLTISEGSIRKYLEPSKRIMDEFKISSYLRQQFLLLEKEADAIFGKKARQLNLAKYR